MTNHEELRAVIDTATYKTLTIEEYWTLNKAAQEYLSILPLVCAMAKSVEGAT